MEGLKLCSGWFIPTSIYEEASQVYNLCTYEHYLYTPVPSQFPLSLALALGINYISAWTGPTALPPGNNTPAPINVGTTNQVKDGNFSVGSSTNATPFNGINPLGLTVLGSQRIDGWLKVGDGATGNPTQPLELTGTPGVDGIKFPDGSVQTVAATGGTFAGMQCTTATSAYISGSANVACAAGYTAVSGGCQSACSMLKENYLSGNTQTCTITNTAWAGICNQAGQTNVRANILCCK